MSPTSSKNRIPLSAISKRPIFCAIAPAEGAQELKQELGLGHYEGRGWRGFHHHATLCIAAYGFLVAERSRFSPSARAGQVDLPVAEMPLKFRPRGSPGTRGAA